MLLSGIRTDYSFILHRLANWRFHIFYQKKRLAGTCRWEMTDDLCLLAHTCSSPAGRKGSFPAHPRPTRAPHLLLPPARPPRTLAPCPSFPSAPRPPRPGVRDARGGGTRWDPGARGSKTRASPVVGIHDVGVRDRFPAQGRVGGFGEEILEIHPPVQSPAATEWQPPAGAERGEEGGAPGAPRPPTHAPPAPLRTRSLPQCAGALLTT